MLVSRGVFRTLRYFPINKRVNKFYKTNRCFSIMASKWQASEMKDTEQWSNHVRGHVPVTVSVDQSEASAVMPGFSYGDLDRTGDVEPWRVMMMMQAGEDNCAFRGQQQQGRNVFDMAEVLEENLVFSVTTKLDLMPELYTCKDDFLYEPVVFREYLNKVGNTSMEVIRELHCEKGYPLSRSAQGLVLVNKETHSPVKHSEKFFKKFGKTKPKIIVERFTPDEKPSDAFHTTYRVMWSDTDYYYHSNQTSYLRYALNGVTEACFAGRLRQFPAGDLASHKVHCMTMVYAAQTRPGDVLDMYTWEDPIINRRIHCQLEKDGRLVYNTAIDFFDQKVLERDSGQGGKQESSKM